MLIEYSIKFEKDGLIITQRMDSGSQAPAVKDQSTVEQNVLGANAPDPLPSVGANAATAGTGGGGVHSPRGPGGAPIESTSGAPITIIGPIILTCPPSATDK
jgi:hypothetical protein